MFKQVYLYIQDKEALEENILYIDGTKFEANANKMTFFWRAWQKRYQPRHWKKCIEIIRQINTYFKKNEINIKYSIIKEPSIEYLIEIDERIEKYIAEKKFIRRRRGKHELAKLVDELKKSAIKMWQYTMATDVLGNRNSFSKTDADAIFMHMKYDYYNHTNVFKPGYNVQAGIVDGYIAHMYISADPNDIKTLQPFLNEFKKQYHDYPNAVVGDAGYGGYDNYEFCKRNSIEAVLKYSGFEAKKKKVNDKNRYHLVHFERTAVGTPICPQGHAFDIERTSVQYIGLTPKITIYYRNSNCAVCPVRNRCTRATKGRTAQVTPALEKEKKRIDELLETSRGKQLLSNRSSQAEGTFADIKENFKYTRLQRRGESGVEVEMKLVGIGFNLRKYHNKKHGKPKDKIILS
ncbi:transposase [Erysipelotrichaceae bacterium MTC7]|nr:transposase [Erysipelotrichaceae bacterium MTC7]